MSGAAEALQKLIEHIGRRVEARAHHAARRLGARLRVRDARVHLVLLLARQALAQLDDVALAAALLVALGAAQVDEPGAHALLRRPEHVAIHAEPDRREHHQGQELLHRSLPREEEYAAPAESSRGAIRLNTIVSIDP